LQKGALRAVKSKTCARGEGGGISERKKTVVFTTLATARSAAFNEFVTGFKCEDIVAFPLIEGTEFVGKGCCTDNFHFYLSEQLSGVNPNDFCSVVLGCTHFVLVKHAFHDFFLAAKIFDGNDGTAKMAKQKLVEANPLN